MDCTRAVQLHIAKQIGRCGLWASTVLVFVQAVHGMLLYRNEKSLLSGETVHKHCACAMFFQGTCLTCGVVLKYCYDIPIFNVADFSLAG